MIFLFGLFGFVFLLVGALSLFLNSKDKNPEIIIEQNAGVLGTKIRVDIGGAVFRPGVFELENEARVQEALILAGGLSSSADRSWVAKNLNLAAKLADGAKIYIPQTGERTLGGLTPTVFDGSGGDPSKININNASEGELDRLPGIGPVSAQKIITGRPYQSIDDLISKKIIGASTFTKIKDQITVW